METYIFDLTRGDGIPGLPHTVTLDEAKALGMEDTLRAAIESGLYKKVKPPKVQTEKEK